MKKKFLIVMMNLNNGGAERSLVNFLQLFDYDRYDVDLLLFKKEGMFLEQVPVKVNMLECCKEIRTLYSSLWGGIFSLKSCWLKMIQIFGTYISSKSTKSGIEKGQYRWIHFYSKHIPILAEKYDTAISFVEGEPMYYLADKVTANKKIAFIHTDYSKLSANMEYDLAYFEQLDKVISISNKCVIILKEMFPSIKNKFMLLPNLISSDVIKKMSNEFQPAEMTENITYLLSIGTLTRLKGFDMAIKAAKILKERELKFKWIIMGKGIQYEELQKQARDDNVEDVIIFIGARLNPYPYIKKSSIIVQTSRYEGKSMVLDEAKILGKPIVVTNYDTVRDQINDKEGIIVGMSPVEIANGIIKMYKMRDKYEMYLKQNEYGTDTEIEKYYEVLK